MSEARAIHAELLSRQLQWADGSGLEADAGAHLAHWRDNCLAPPSQATRAELEKSRHLRGHADGKPGPLHALGSGLALAVNMFDIWRERADELAGALPEIVPPNAVLRFCVPFASSPRAAEAGRELDLLLESESGPPTAVLPLFAEPFDDLDPTPDPDLVANASSWPDLPGCRGLARDLLDGPARFRHLAVGRILEAAIEMRHRFGVRRFRVAVLHHDAGGAPSRRIRLELDQVRMRVGGELELAGMSWHSVASRLASHVPADAGYTRGIRARYLEAPPARVAKTAPADEAARPHS